MKAGHSRTHRDKLVTPPCTLGKLAVGGLSSERSRELGVCGLQGTPPSHCASLSSLSVPCICKMRSCSDIRSVETVDRRMDRKSEEGAHGEPWAVREWAVGGCVFTERTGDRGVPAKLPGVERLADCLRERQRQGAPCLPRHGGSLQL